MATSTEELQLRASTVVETLNTVLDTLIPVMQLYPELPARMRNDSEVAIDAIVRFHKALRNWSPVETPRDIQRMRDTLQHLSWLGHAADDRLQSQDPDTTMEDLGCWGALRQIGELADRALGNDWPAVEDNDADLFA